MLLKVFLYLKKSIKLIISKKYKSILHRYKQGEYETEDHFREKIKRKRILFFIVTELLFTYLFISLLVSFSSLILDFHISLPPHFISCISLSLLCFPSPFSSPILPFSLPHCISFLSSSLQSLPLPPSPLYIHLFYFIFF